MEDKMEFKGYNTSKDYVKLFEYINNGYRIPAWIVYSDKFKEPIYDLVEVRMSKLYRHYTIGTRGIGYESGDNILESFISDCESINLQFITF